MSIQKKIAALVERQLPGFVRQDHPKFIAFLEAYYEWLAQDGNAEERLKNIPNNQDIDTTLDQFVEFFNKEFLPRIPQEILADRRELSKHIKEYYRARGTEKSYKLLFRILFNSDVEFYYPHVDMLRVSDGKWQQDITIKVQMILGKGNPGDFESRTIVGKTSKASAVVDKIIKYYAGPYEVYELYLNRSSILGTFLPNETIYSREVDGTEARVYPVVTGVSIIDPGGDYTEGGIINFTGGSGLDAKGKIQVVGLDGEIVTVAMTNTGVGYDVPPTAVPPFSTAPANIVPIIGAMTRAAGYYLNQDGQVSSSKRIQDSYFYQQFSYVVYVEESIEKYREIIKQLIHPAGLILFGGIRSVNEVNVETNVPSSRVSGNAASQIRIERVSLPPYPLDPDREDYRSFINKGPIHGDTVVGASEIINARLNSGAHSPSALRLDIRLEAVIREGVNVFKLGPSMRSFERDKFKALPSENSEDATPMDGVNAGYWDQYGNQQIGHFADWVIGDFEFFAYRRINIMPDPILKSKL